MKIYTKILSKLTVIFKRKVFKIEQIVKISRTLHIDFYILNSYHMRNLSLF